MRGALTAIALHAAPARSASLTLEDAIRLAADRSEAVVIAGTLLDRAEADRRRALSEWLPQVNGQVSYDRTLDTEFEAFLEPSPTGQPSAFEGLPFGQRNIWKASVSVAQSIYAGGRTQARLEVARHARTVARASVESARAQAVLSVVQAYCDAVLARRMVEIAEEQERLLTLTLDQVRAAYAQQTRAAFDVLRAEVALGNQRPVVLERRAAWEVAQRNLRQLLDLPGSVSYELTTPIDAPLEELPDPGAVARRAVGIFDETTRVPVVQAEATVAIRDVGVGVAWSQHLPRLDATMNYQLVNYPDKVIPDVDDLRRNWTVGVALQVPIFAGFRVSADVDAARADLIEASARLRQTRDLARLDEAQTQLTLDTALEALAATLGSVEQAREAVDIAALRHREGLATHLELQDAQLLFTQAAANRARAARDVQVARVRLALLPALPISTAVGAQGALGATSGVGQPANAPGAVVGGTTQGGAGAGSMASSGLGGTASPTAGAGSSGAQPGAQPGAQSGAQSGAQPAGSPGTWP